MIDLSRAVVFDIELLKNVFTCHVEAFESDVSFTFEISEFRDDRVAFHAWLRHCQATRTPMIGFNNVHFDYPIIHHFYTNPNCTVDDLYEKMQSIFKSQNGFGHTVWASDRLAPQIDVFKINHFDNKAKTTSLKALQINMRAPTVVDSPVEFGTALTRDQIATDLIPYNKHDVKETKRFAHICRGAIDFRAGLIGEFGDEVLNYNDVKIGAMTMEKRLGDDLCYEWRDMPGEFTDWGTPRRRRFKRQTKRDHIALAGIIFPYVRFEHPEFQRVLDYMRTQVLTPDDLDDPDALVKTKGVFKNLIAHVGGLDFYFGTGGMHASVERQRFVASDEWPIEDIDVAAMYPTIARVNQLYPEHLGHAYVAAYAGVIDERQLYAKGTRENAMLKLAANGPWGQSNNPHTVFLDSRYAMTIPINGQLMICMLAEWLANVPTLRIIQANTDGITYQVHKTQQATAALYCRMWEDRTGLVLESAHYARMWIADVNTYVAETTSGKLKQKGRLWHPDPDNYAESISNASPPAWHKDLSNCVSIQAAVQAMVNGIDVESYIRSHRDPFDFMCRAKADRASKLMLGDHEVQRTTRYYVANEGLPLVKISPPRGPEGMFKRKAKVTEADYMRVMTANNWQWSAEVCTGKADKPETQGRYATVRTAIEAGWKVAECNDALRFDWSNVNYDWYVAAARKLVII